jgi:hypothetical protein
MLQIPLRRIELEGDGPFTVGVIHCLLWWEETSSMMIDVSTSSATSSAFHGLGRW